MARMSIYQKLIARLYVLVNSKEDRLRYAAQKGDLEQIQALLAQGAHINSKPVSKMPTTSQGAALHIAAEHGQCRAVELLLKEGADPNPVNFYGLTPLSLWYRTVDRLMSKGDILPHRVPQDMIDTGVALMEHGARAGIFRSRSHPKGIKHPAEPDNPRLTALKEIVRAHVEQREMARSTPMCAHPTGPSSRL